MFTGIIEQVGEIKAIDGNRFVVSHDYEELFEAGESVALNGMCATVVEANGQVLSVDIIQESRKLTTFGQAAVGDRVNLERAAQMGQRNSGHNVTGHIDEVGTITGLDKIEDYWLVRVQINPEHRQWVVFKGSVALAGISLTVSGVSEFPKPLSLNPSPAGRGANEEAWLEVSIIPHTWEHTTLQSMEVGDGINVEFDVLGKYAVNHQDCHRELVSESSICKNSEDSELNSE